MPAAAILLNEPCLRVLFQIESNERAKRWCEYCVCCFCAETEDIVRFKKDVNDGKFVSIQQQMWCYECSLGMIRRRQWWSSRECWLFGVVVCVVRIDQTPARKRVQLFPVVVVVIGLNRSCRVHTRELSLTREAWCCECVEWRNSTKALLYEEEASKRGKERKSERVWFFLLLERDSLSRRIWLQQHLSWCDS